MRHISKQLSGPECLLRAERGRPPATSRKAKKRWRNFKKTRDRDELKEVLCNEQYGLCAYTELRLGESGLGTHVEHIKPKSKFPQLTFSHENLLLCALGGDDIGRLKLGGDDSGNNDTDDASNSIVFGGHAKEDKFDEELFLSPLQERPMKHGFLYLSNGRVEPFPSVPERQRKKIEYTIDLLNLNAAYLVNQRKRWIDELEQDLAPHYDDDTALYKLAASNLVPRDNKLDSFFTATRQKFSCIAERVLEERAPELLAW